MYEVKDPPIIEFNLRFQFPNIEDLDISNLNKIRDEFSNEYDVLPKMRLHSSRTLDRSITLGPMEFTSTEKGKKISIFRDAIEFSFIKYPTFKEILPDITRNMSFLLKTLDVLSINQIRSAYKDEFLFKKSKNFQLKSYFKLHPKHPDTFSLNYGDFFLGVNIETEEENHNSVMRIRSQKSDSEELYKFHVETLYVIEEIVKTDNEKEIIDLVNQSHEFISRCFWDMLTQNTNNLIGRHELNES